MRAATALLLAALPLSSCVCVPMGARPCREQVQCEDGAFCFVEPGADVGRCLGADDLRDAGVPFDDAGNPLLDAGPEPPTALPADRVEVGSSYQCARTEGRTLSCWGLNRSGRLGHSDDTLGGPLAPREVAGLAEVESFATGDRHTCAIGVRGGERAVWCWGDGNATGRASPLPPGAVGKPDLDDAVHAAAAVVTIGQQDTCVVTTTENVWCWGPGSVTGSATPAAAGSFQGNAEVFHSEAAVCGDVGVTGLDCSPSPAALEVGCTDVGELVRCDFLDGATAVDWSSANVCSLSSGALSCAGGNEYGVIDPTAPVDGDYPPTAVSLPGEVLEVASDTQHACALSDDGLVRCWGRNLWGAVGQAEDAEGDVTCAAAADPWFCFGVTVIDGPTDVVDIGAYGTTTCAVEEDGDVWCWGRYNAQEGTLPTRVRLSR